MLTFLETLLLQDGAIMKETLCRPEHFDFASVYMSSTESSNSDLASTNASGYNNEMQFTTLCRHL